MTKSQLTPSQKQLLETFQGLNFGRIEHLVVRDGEPVLNPSPRIKRNIKLGADDNDPRPERESQDFHLKREHADLFEQLTRLGDGIVEVIEVRHGLPFMLTVEQRM